MVEIKFNISEAEAEEFLIGLSMRHKQLQQLNNPARASEVNELGERLSRELERKLGADAGWWLRHRDQDFRVKITAPKVVYR